MVEARLRFRRVGGASTAVPMTGSRDLVLDRTSSASQGHIRIGKGPAFQGRARLVRVTWGNNPDELPAMARRAEIAVNKSAGSSVESAVPVTVNSCVAVKVLSTAKAAAGGACRP